MGTERISSFQSSPATTFALHCDIVSTEPSYGEHGRWRVRMELHAANGPGGTTGSAFLGPGTQSGQRAKDGGGYTTVLTHSGNPFLPSGYANGQTRWVDAQEFYLVANANGYWSGSLTSITLRMPLAYGSVNVTPSGSMPIPRISRAPGKPGKPTVSNLTKNSARFSWGAAARGNANIQDYGVYVSTSPTFNTHTFQDWVGTGTSFQLGNILQPNTTYYVRVRARNADGTGAYSDVTSFTTLPDKPTAPVIGTPERVSDTQQTVKWTRKASTAAPYTQQQVQRRTHDGAWGAWTGVATLSTPRTNEAAESWTDNGTVPNRAYEYRVKASNTAGEATSGPSVTVYTTPGAPATLVAEKTADNKVKLTLAQTVPHTAYETELEYSTDGGDNWTPLAVLGAGVLTYTWDNPVLTDPLTFRARVVIDTNTGVGRRLRSTWRTSNTIQLIDKPTAPVIGTPERVSDTQQTVKWTRKASTAAPYTQQQVQRRTHDGAWGAWTGVATLSTPRTNEAAESWTDNGTVPNRAYQYRIKASNTAGEATSGPSVTVYTTPGAPATLVAEKTADNKVKLTIAQTVPHTAYETELEYSTDGGDNWTPLAVLGAGVLTYTWDNPVLTDPLVFRARVVIDTNTGVGRRLRSTWRTSNTIQLAAPPNKPSALNPNGVAFDGGQARVFTWQHNPVDTSPQSQYQIRYREQGAGSWTTLSAVASDVSAHEFAAATFENGKSYEWAVRTWGIHEDPSPWSATATFNATTPPVATITSPQVTHDTSQLQAAWTYYDEESTAQAAWQAELVRGGSVIEQRSGSGAATSTTFQTLLTDATTYTVRVRVQDGDGLWSAWDEVTFTTAFDTPPQPYVALQWDENEGCVHITVGNPEADSGEVTADHNAVYRSLDGGQTWELLEDELDLDGTITDRTLPLGQEVQYKAVAWSVLPSSIESEVAPITPPAEDVYWSGGEGFTIVARAQGDIGQSPAVNLTNGLLTRRLHYFAGRTLPVEAAGTQRARTGSVQFVTLTAAQLAAVRELAYLPAPHLIRTPDGIHVYCSIGPVQEERIEDEIYRITFDVQEVEA